MAIVALKPQELPLHGWTEIRLRALATELARDILDVEDILRNHNVSAVEWEQIGNSRAFLQMLAEARQVWGCDLNTKERVELKAQYVVENALEMAQQFINDKSETGVARVNMLTFVAKLAGWVDKGVQTGVGTAIHINIDKGGGRVTTAELPHRVIDATAIDVSDQ